MKERNERIDLDRGPSAPAPLVEQLYRGDRTVETAQPGDRSLGVFDQLPGRWEASGTGWNLIALPHAVAAGPAFRLLLNQYDEVLKFTLVDKGVPNRGVDATHQTQTDQVIVTLDYEQVIHQVAVVDRPETDETIKGRPGAAIHHEPGLLLNMLNWTIFWFDPEGELSADELAEAIVATFLHGAGRAQSS